MIFDEALTSVRSNYFIVMLLSHTNSVINKLSETFGWPESVQYDVVNKTVNKPN